MAKPTDSQRSTISSTVAAFMATQASIILGRIRDGESDWWGDNDWDGDLAGHLHPKALDIAAESGRKEADKLGSEYDADRTSDFLEAVALSRAKSLNSTTRDQLTDTLDSDEPDPAHVFEKAQNSRSDGFAVMFATFLAGFGTHEAAAQHAQRTGGTATKTWVTGPNPRTEHAAMNGETVGLDDVFSDGQAWPGEGGDPALVANCNCSIDVEVSMPGSAAVSRRFFAKASTATRFPLKVENLAPGVATMRLYDVIDSWGWPFGISAADFAAQLDALPESTTQIQLHINSPGGEATEGLAIVNLLRAHPAEVVCIVDGLAASAASFIAAGAGTLVMLPNSELMIHDAWGVCIGNAADMTQTADLLNHLSDNIAGLYAAKAGGSTGDWRAAMGAETWYSAQEALDAGLADSLGDPAQYPMVGEPPPPPSEELFEELADAFDLSSFRYQSRAQAPTPMTPVASASGPSRNEGSAAVDLTDQHVSNLRTHIGFAEDADADTIVAAVIEALGERAEEPPQASITPPEGMVLVSAAKLDADRAENAALTQRVSVLEADKAQARHEQQVMDAIRAGKIMPFERQGYLNALDMDEEGATKRLDALTPGLVPFAEIGHDQGVQAEIDRPRGWSDYLFTDEKKG